MKSRQRASVSVSVAVRASAGANSRRSRLEQATLRWCISSPMVSPRAMMRLQRYAADLPQRPPQGRPQHVAQPGEPRQHLGIVAAEAHHLAEALVDGAVGAVAERAVLDHQQRLADRGHARSSARRRRSDGWAGSGTHRPQPSPRPPRGPSPSPRTRQCPSRRRASGRTCAPRRSAARHAGCARAPRPAIASPAGTTSTSTGSPASIRLSASALARSIVCTRIAASPRCLPPGRWPAGPGPRAKAATSPRRPLPDSA